MHQVFHLKNTTNNIKTSYKTKVKKKISYCLKCRNPTRNKDIHEALPLVNLMPQQSSKCKTCNARKSGFVKEYKPNKKQ